MDLEDLVRRMMRNLEEQDRHFSRLCRLFEIDIASLLRLAQEPTKQHDVSAESAHGLFVSLVDAGFSEEQALHLVGIAIYGSSRRKATPGATAADDDATPETD